MPLLRPLRVWFVRTLALAGSVALSGAACEKQTPAEPGVGGFFDMPVALLSASAPDATTTELYLVNASGATAPKLVPTFSGAKWEVRWSGDGRRLAVTGNTYAGTTAQAATASDVWTLNADGTGLLQLTHDGMSGSPHWLPDGRLVYARVSEAGAVGWFAVPAGGGAPVPITLRNGQPVFAPDWSRGSGELTFSDDVTIYAAAADGTGERAVATGELPRWSPAGDRLAYAGRVNGASTLVVANVNGQGRPVAVASLAQFVSGFAWSQDGTQIAWVRASDAGQPEAVVGPASGSGEPAPLVPRAAGVVAYDVDLDWRPTALP